MKMAVRKKNNKKKERRRVKHSTTYTLPSSADPVDRDDQRILFFLKAGQTCKFVVYNTIGTLLREVKARGNSAVVYVKPLCVYERCTAPSVGRPD